jgi:hypothetical protein
MPAQHRILVLFAISIAITGTSAAQTPAEAARQYTTAHRAELHQSFSDFLAIPNVAADPQGLQRNAGLLVQMLRQRGVESQLLSMAGAPPVVYGSIDVPGAKHTIVFYAHYDGQPVTPSEWKVTPPFKPIVRDVDGEPRIYGRGAGDDKGAIFAQLTALDALRKAGIAPRANIRFVWEAKKKPVRPISKKFSWPIGNSFAAMSSWSAMDPSIKAASRPSSSARAAIPTWPSRSTGPIMDCIAATTATGRPTPP